MRRRDTIIVAVVVNAALLMILFATAMRSDQPKEEKPIVAREIKKEVPAKPLAVARKDVLNEYVASSIATVDKTKEVVIPIEEEITLEISGTYDEPIKPPPSVKEEQIAVKDLSDGSFVNVTVKKGDFLEKIAKANSTTVAAIMQANKMGTTQLKVGQVLKIPFSSSEPVQKSPSVSKGEEFYTVKDGDNPWLIATRNKISLEELLRLNDLDEQKARKLRPGDKLKIR